MTHDTDQLGQRLAAMLGEPELPAHLQARLRSARAQAIARKGTPAQSSVNRMGSGLLAFRLEHPFLLPFGALLLALTIMYASTSPTAQPDFDWQYHVQAEESELVHLEGGA